MNKKMRIVTDTAVSLPDEVIEEYNITLVPGYVVIDGKRYVDYFELSRAEFYRLLETSSELPEAIDANVDDFKNLYRALLSADPYSPIVSLHVSGKLAQTADAARQAAASFPDAAIRIFDTNTVAAAQGLMVWEAARMADAGNSLSAILMTLSHMRDGMQTYFVLDTLEYLRRGGRVNTLQAMLGSLLDIKPLLTLRDGLVLEAGQHRSRARALEALEQLVIDSGKDRAGLKIGVVHALCEDEARKLAYSLGEALQPENIMVAELSGGVGSNTGPNALGVCWYAPGLYDTVKME